MNSIEPPIASMARAPTPQEEDGRRVCRFEYLQSATCCTPARTQRRRHSPARVAAVVSVARCQGLPPLSPGRESDTPRAKPTPAVGTVWLTWVNQIFGRDYQASGPRRRLFLERELPSIWVERKVTDLQTLFLVLAELYGKHAFDVGKKRVPEQDAEFMAVLGPHTEGLTKRMVTRWLAGWNNANRGQLAS
jgi:hypothetical protein